MCQVPHGVRGVRGVGVAGAAGVRGVPTGGDMTADVVGDRVSGLTPCPMCA